MFPAWETLPFERVSPSVETMGQRLELLWRLRDPERCPAVIVTGVRALLQRLGPGRHRRSSRSSSAPATSIDPDELRATARRVRLPPRGARRAPRRVRPARRDHRRLPVDRRRADPHRPVGRRGRPADRRSASTTSARSPTSPRCCIFPARELMPTDDVRARAAKLVADRAVGPRAVGAPRRGRAFDGMESWLPWLIDDDQLLTDVLPDDGQGGARRAAPDARPGRSTCSPRRTTSPGAGLDVGPRPRQAVPPPARRPRHAARRARTRSGRSTRRRSRPTRPLVEASGWGPVAGDGAGLDRPPDRAARPRATASSSPPTATARPSAWPRCCATTASTSRSSPASDGDLTKPGGSHRRRPAAPRLHAARRQAGDRRRERPHRPPPRPPHGPAAQARQAPASSRTSRPATTSCTTSTASASTRAWSSARSAASSATTCCSPTRAATSSTCRATRSTRCASTSAARRRRCTASAAADFAKAKSRVRSAVREIAQELVVLYQKRVNAEGHAFGQDTPWQHEMEEAFPFVETPDQRIGDRRRQGRHGAALPDGPPGVRRRRLRQDRGRHPRRVQGDPGRQAGRRARPDDAARHAARQHVRRPLRRLPDPRRGALPVPHRRPGQEGRSTGVESGEVDCVIGTHRLLGDERQVQGPRPAGRRRGAALRRAAQGGDEEAEDERRRPHAHRPRRSRARWRCSLVGIRDLSLLQTPPADRQPILTYVGEYDERVAVEAIRRELLREGQVFWVHNRVQSIEHRRRAACASWCPRRASPSPTGRWTRARSSRSCVDFWDGQLRRARVHDDHRVGHRHADGEHARRRALRPARPRPDAPAARPRRPQRVSGPTPTCSTRATRC